MMVGACVRAGLWGEIQDLPRHLGQHSGGMVIRQGQLDAVVPLENASMPGRVVVQWDKDDCADMGIVKVDLLGLGMMAVIQDSLRSDQHAGVRGSGFGIRANAQKCGPLAAQSRDDPEPYSLPARTISGVHLHAVTSDASKIVNSSPAGRMHRPRPPLEPGTSRLRRRTLGERAAHHHLVVAAPRAVGLKSLGLDPVLDQVAACRRVDPIEPAGEMWSVVTESPSDTRQRAPAMSVLIGARGGTPRR